MSFEKVKFFANLRTPGLRCPQPEADVLSHTTEGTETYLRLGDPVARLVSREKSQRNGIPAGMLTLHKGAEYAN
jgi:hypothetical protein